jgi:hypothetical protein
VVRQHQTALTRSTFWFNQCCNNLELTAVLISDVLWRPVHLNIVTHGTAVDFATDAKVRARSCGSGLCQVCCGLEFGNVDPRFERFLYA